MRIFSKVFPSDCYLRRMEIAFINGTNLRSVLVIGSLFFVFFNPSFPSYLFIQFWSHLSLLRLRSQKFDEYQRVIRNSNRNQTQQRIENKSSKKINKEFVNKI